MGIFCTRCGTENSAEDAFCQNCGTPLRKPAASTEVPPALAPSSDPLNPPAAVPRAPETRPSAKRAGLWVAGGVVSLLLIGGVAYFLTKQPDASAANLLAAAQQDLGEQVAKHAPQTLCLENMNYAADPFNVAAYDRRTQEWLDMLSSAGLYEKTGTVMGGNAYFPQPLVQYKPTATLQTWRQGSALCLAREVKIAQVTDIAQPQDEAATAESPARHTVRAQIVLHTTDLADWMGKPGVADKVLPQLSNWSRDAQQLAQSRPAQFVVKDGAWRIDTPAPAASRKGRAREDEDRANEASATPDWWSRLTSAVGFKAHALEGSWEMDEATMAGAFVDKGVRLTFTADTCQIGPKSMPCRFVTQGKRVKVYPSGGDERLDFEVVNEHTVQLDMGLMTLTYKRMP